EAREEISEFVEEAREELNEIREKAPDWIRDARRTVPDFLQPDEPRASEPPTAAAEEPPARYSSAAIPSRSVLTFGATLGNCNVSSLWLAILNVLRSGNATWPPVVQSAPATNPTAVP